MVASIERYLKKKSYGFSVINSIEFAGTREVLKAKQKALKSSRKGNKPNASRSLTDSEVDELYRKGQLGSETPEAMLNTLWFNNTTHFSKRGGKEHRDLCWGDIQLKEDISDCKAIQQGPLAPRVFRTATAPGSEVLFPLEVLHLARRRLGSAPTSKGLFSRCVENVSRYESFVRLYLFFSGPFSFRNLREYPLVIYSNSFWHKTYFIHRIFKRTAVDAD